jgi:ribosome-associated heat shock protein Hsp15
MDSVRVDRWLYAARIFKSRTQATSACVGGHIKVNQSGAKAHHMLQVGDEVRAQTPGTLRVLIVAKLADKRLSAALARELYEDRSPPPLDTRLGSPQRERGTGRPTKRDRRALQQLKRGR